MAVEARPRRYSIGYTKFSRYARVVGIVSCLVLFTLIGPVAGEEWHDTNEGHGTTHEQLGQQHYPSVDLTAYKSKIRYTSELNRTSWNIKPAFNLSQFFFDHTITDTPSLPRGYLAVRNGDTLVLGPKVVDNDWSDLLGQYFLLILWVIILVALIILIPFFAVCYCCFCCCRRCKRGCAPCDEANDKRRALICAVILALLLVFILLGAIIGYTSNRGLDRGLAETASTVRRGNEDTCRFLEDVNAHIHHIFVYNYEELEAHLTDLLNNAHHHIFLDLADTSESNAVEHLERIFDNMIEARILMKQVVQLDQDLRFYTTQLRDGVRGAKRDVNYACSNLISNNRCKQFLKNSELEFVDTSNCLHLDNMPNTSLFLEGIEKIIKDDVTKIPLKALERFQDIASKIETAMNQVIPPLLHDINQGREKFRIQATNIRKTIESVISDIHLRTLRSTESFEDVYEKFGKNRSYINALVCILLLVIVILMTVGLICGCTRSKPTGATCLLMGIILIFAVFSFLVLIGLFYFMVGLVTYQGACAPLRDLDKNALFRELDAVIDLNRIIRTKDAGLTSDVEVNEANEELRMSKAIKSCNRNQSIFDLLKDNNIYRVEDLTSITIMSESKEEDKKDSIFEEDLSAVYLLTSDERIKLEKAHTGNLSGYHSVLYVENMCQALTPNLATISAGLRKVRDDIYYSNRWDSYSRYGRVAMINEAYHFDMYNYEWSDKILKIMAKMKQKLLRIDDLILYENRNFTNSITVLANAVIRAENFLKSRGSHFINSLGQNLTDVVNEQVDEFIRGIMDECNRNVGRCAPLSYIYYRGVDLVCYRLVDPINGFWMGILPAALLLLPLLYVAHKLMCLWKRMHAYAVAVVVVPEPQIGGCPTCTGAPYMPPPIITCTGGKQTYCPCEPSRPGGGGAVIDLETTESKTSTEEAETAVEVRSNPLPNSRTVAPKPDQESPAVKRKKD
ncbi:prominin-like protein [Drosophila novamexicana]|uniref:prominin-like protein n=1 Tax=Drosophila novamexicana TaxID=47314 RepID=UPI0011E5F830|nr:prominin-like protein [Drosophila novamexicana]